jgi:glucosamine--fructose-6-phosphate aminotransferase (isomerizing)
MCGIVGYVGCKDAYPIIIKGLKRLEYRGYDSAGVAIGSDSGIATLKQKGKVSDLEAYIAGQNTSGSIGIGHTRWATHGVPNQVNSHPHNSSDGKLSIIHNGIIENYASIKTALETKGHTFKSDTDTEVLIHLIEDIKKYENVSLFEAVRIALDEVVGAYAIVVMEKGITNEFIAARKGSPLLIGVGCDEYYIASDATPIIEYTNEVVYLEDVKLLV